MNRTIGIGALLVGSLVFIGKSVFDNYKTAKSLKEAEEYISNSHRTYMEECKAREDKIDAYCKEMGEWLESIQSKLIKSGMTVEESIELARVAGVPEEKIIHDKDELDKFFLD